MSNTCSFIERGRGKGGGEGGGKRRGEKRGGRGEQRGGEARRGRRRWSHSLLLFLLSNINIFFIERPHIHIQRVPRACVRTRIRIHTHPPPHRRPPPPHVCTLRNGYKVGLLLHGCVHDQLHLVIDGIRERRRERGGDRGERDTFT